MGISRSFSNMYFYFISGEEWHDAIDDWAEKRVAVAKTFALKNIATMMDDEWLSATGRYDLEGLKLGLSKKLGKRETMA